MSFDHSQGVPIADRILDRLADASGELTRTELGKNLGHSEKVARTLDILLRTGKITCEIERTKSRGRPVEKWRLL